MEKLKSIYIDCAAWDLPVNVDDFLVAIGVNKSNSVYHVAEVKAVEKPEFRLIRYYCKVLNSDLITALKRGENQRVITLYWYKRESKQKRK